MVSVSTSRGGSGCVASSSRAASCAACSASLASYSDSASARAEAAGPADGASTSICVDRRVNAQLLHLDQSAQS
jgi:hypothetical protein